MALTNQAQNFLTDGMQLALDLRAIQLRLEDYKSRYNNNLFSNQADFRSRNSNGLWFFISSKNKVIMKTILNL